MRHGHFQELSAGAGKRERTRSALLDAAIEVVAEKGMEAARISDITTAARLANGTFYNHFTDKDEILREAAYGLAVEVARQLDEDMAGIEDAARRVVTATSQIISILLAEPEWAATLLDSADYLPGARADMCRYMRRDIEAGVRQCKFDVDVSDFLLDQLIALIGVALRAQLENGPDPRLTRQICESMLRLLGMAPARARKAAMLSPDIG